MAKTLFKITAALFALAAACLVALYLSLPSISAQMIRNLLEKQGLSNVQVVEDSLGLQRARFKSIRFSKKFGEKTIEVNLRNIEARYSYDSLASRSISGLGAEEAEIRLLGFGALPMDSVRLTGLELNPGTEKTIIDFEWPPALPEGLRTIALSPAVQLKDHSLKKAEMKLPKAFRVHLEIFQGSGFEVHGSVKGEILAQLGDGAGWNFLEARLSEAAFLWKKSVFSLDTTLRTNGELETRISARYTPEAGKGDLRYKFTPLSFTKKPMALSTLFPGLAYDLELRAGELSLAGDLRFALTSRGADFLAKSELKAKDISGVYNQKTEFSGLSTDCASAVRSGKTELACPALALSRLGSTVPVTNLRFGLALSHDTKATKVNGRDFHAELIGGEVNAREFFLDLTKEAKTKQPVNLEVRHLDLQELLKLKQNEQVSASGLLDGQIPLTLEPAGFRVRDGALAARGPGLIRYQAGGMAEANPALGLAMQALENFEYTQLSTKLDYEPQGTMRFSITLQGRNPHFKSGQVFHFNINVEENILALFRSMTIADDFDRSIDQRVEESQSRAQEKAKRKK